MLNFLRKLRRKEMKGTRYLKYAVGEIFLVVVGILIALGINNRNTERQQQNELEDYLIQVSQNIEEDIKKAIAIKAQRDSVIINSRKAIDLYVQDKFDHDVMLRAAISNFIEFYFTPNTSGFEALKSSGFIGKIKNKVILKNLYDYYAQVEKIQLDERSANLFIEEMEAQWIGRTPIAKVFFYSQVNINDLGLEQGVIERIKQENSQALKDPAVEGAILRGGSNAVIQEYYLELIAVGGKFIEHINAMK